VARFQDSGRLFGIGPEVPIIQQYDSHPITRDMAGISTLFPLTRSVETAKTPPTGVNLTTLAKTSSESWAETSRLPFTTFKDLSRKPEVSALIAEAVARVNQDLPEVARVRAFGLFDKELDADDGELTRTNKVRRATILDKYREMIEELYARDGAGDRVAMGDAR